MELNFHAKRRLVEAVLPALQAGGRGRVINFIGSLEPMRLSAGFSCRGNSVVVQGVGPRGRPFGHYGQLRRPGPGRKCPAHAELHA